MNSTGVIFRTMSGTYEVLNTSHCNLLHISLIESSFWQQCANTEAEKTEGSSIHLSKNLNNVVRREKGFLGDIS